MAIKVNGTTVINDSRALSNIASVDATTAGAMAAAGVGGLSTVVATDASMGTGSSLSFTLGDYQIQHFYFDGFFQHSGQYGARQLIRLSDSSGNSITGSEYCSIGQFGDYNTNSTTDSYLLFNGDDINSPGENTRYHSLHITVRDAYSSTKRTKWEINYKFIKTNALTSNNFQHRNGLMLNAEKNNSIIFTLQSNQSFAENGAKYSSIGVN
jgi:hypothetical protein